MRKKYRLKTEAALAVLIAANCFAQTAPDPSFEAASIRSSANAGSSDIQITRGSFTARDELFLSLLEWAFDLPIPQMDYPAWFQSERYDIVAKAPAAANETEMRAMLRKLLADRFALKTHTEARVMQVYALTLARGGPKFQESKDEGSYSMDQTGVAGISARHARMADLAEGIARSLERPVVDETGLRGRYEIRLDLAAYAARSADGRMAPGQFDMASLLFNGLHDLLGLKLESRKESVHVLVTDHAEKVPTEN